MTNFDNLVAEADRYLDEGKYSSARDAYRAAATLSAPTKRLMWNLAVAEESEHLQYIRDLILLYPSSLEIQLELIKSLIRIAEPENAVVECTKLLHQGNLTMIDELLVRWSRFRAAVSSRSAVMQDRYKTIAEDFSVIWRAGETDIRATQSRSDLVRELAALRYPAAIPVLEALMAEVGVPPQVKQFLEIKIHELQMLDNINRTLESRIGVEDENEDSLQ